MFRSLALAARRQGAVAAVQQSRCYAAEAAVAAKADVWEELGDLVTSDEGKRELASLRTTYADVAGKLKGMAKPQPAINWEQWGKDMDPKLVLQFKSAYESMKLPKYDGKDVEEAQAKFTALMSEAEALVGASQSRIAEIKGELAAIQKEKERLDTTTIDEELAANPELAKEIDEELQKNHFMVV
ncbi:ATP synthase subunit mitochondrial [Micractinium conductrix]|uniref:ATP synthase subunit mitochondrial n=1 Tax=Micractinium conductrix TaxID=554055 RepID=A0A2P6VPR1_9CHLO|nr:ATP synthase subunit mitochondrial [Micractinium conductrix]|eukprot:PSC76047.1 ATP synthase subunit mitochondrial [Micractinium conductrix]